MSVSSLRLTLRGGKPIRSLCLFGRNVHGHTTSNLPTSQPFSSMLVKGFASNANGPHDYSYTEDDDRFESQKPTIQYAKGMPRSFSGMRHEQILQLCVEGSYPARREALIRNIMSVDEIEYGEAEKKVSKIRKENREMMTIEYLPYHAGIASAAVAGVASFPMIFHADTVLWFNEKFVTTDVPEAADIETLLEVGSFSWSWMEPIIGQASFVFLVLQFLRNQAINLGFKPYNDKILSVRSNRMIKRYPQYDPIFVEWFAESEALYGMSRKG